MMTYSLVTIVHDDGKCNFDAIENRIKAVNQSAVVSGSFFELLVIDNSKNKVTRINRLVEELGGMYHWCDGYNTFHGPSMNIAAELVSQEAVIYFCANHGKIFDPSWVQDILLPLEDTSCGMAGCITSCLFDRVSGDPGDRNRRQEHVQGAIAAIRRDTLLEVPYSHRFPFEYSDVIMSLDLVRNGYYLGNVPSIKSVGEGVVREKGKYVHDYS